MDSTCRLGVGANPIAGVSLERPQNFSLLKANRVDVKYSFCKAGFFVHVFKRKCKWFESMVVLVVVCRVQCR